MKTGNPISDISNSVVHALLHGLPAIKYQGQQRPEGISFEEFKRQWGSFPIVTMERRPDLEDLDIFMFPQGWGSTSLGFGGIGAASMCQANTVVVVCRKAVAASIYFAGQHCYNVDLSVASVQKQLNDDIRDRRVASRADADARYRVGSCEVEPCSQDGIAP